MIVMIEAVDDDLFLIDRSIQDILYSSIHL